MSKRKALDRCHSVYCIVLIVLSYLNDTLLVQIACSVVFSNT